MARARKAVLKRTPATKTTQDRRCWPRFVPDFRRTFSTTSAGSAIDSPSKKVNCSSVAAPSNAGRLNSEQLHRVSDGMEPATWVDPLGQDRLLDAAGTAVRRGDFGHLGERFCRTAYIA